MEKNMIKRLTRRTTGLKVLTCITGEVPESMGT